MTFAAACSWSLLRSVVVAVVGLWGAVHLARLVSQQRGRVRALGWALVLAPCLSPGLIVGYAYRNYSLSLVHYPWWNEALYAAIVIGQAAPVATLLLWFAPPPPVSASAVHCLRLAGTTGGATVFFRVGRRLRVVLNELRGPRQSWLAALAVLFLIAFQESEVAALMQVRGWPEWLFTRYAGLVDLASTRNRMLVLVAIQAVAVIPVIGWLWGNLRVLRRSRDEPQRRVSPGWWLWPAALGVLVTVIPSAVVLGGAWQGLGSLREQPSFWQELAHGLVFALTAGGIAWTLAGALLRGFGGDGRRGGAGVSLLHRPRLDLQSGAGTDPVGRGVPIAESDAVVPGGSRGTTMPAARTEWGAVVGPVLLGLLLLPGLSGSMTLALLVDGLFQQAWLRWAYDSPARILTALALSLLPRAVLVQTCVPNHRHTSDLHCAALLHNGGCAQRRAGRELQWRLRGRPRFWAYVLVCSWAYLDLMIATISAPPGMEPVVKRLYNFMHFGHLAGLSAMVCATVAAPVALVGSALWLRRWWSGRNSA